MTILFYNGNQASVKTVFTVKQDPELLIISAPYLSTWASVQRRMILLKGVLLEVFVMLWFEPLQQNNFLSSGIAFMWREFAAL